MKLKKASITIKIVIVALAVYACISWVSVKGQVAEARAELEMLRAQVAERAQENAALEYQLAHAEDLETVEDIARGKLGLVKPGEKIFYDIGR